MTSRNCIHLFSRLSYFGENGISAIPFSVLPSRSTYILQRRYPVALVKKGEEDHYRRLKAKNYIYDLVEDTDVKKQRNIQVVLKSYVEGVGQKGDVIEVKKNVGYHKLLLPGLADYATDEDIQFMKESSKDNDCKQFSSKTAPLTVKYLERLVLNVLMNKETPWTLEPWHVKVALRKAGVHLPLEAIKLPKQPIIGPDVNLENKDFIVLVTINRKEVANVRSRIHHWSTNIQDRLPFVVHPWCEAGEPMFKEEAPTLQKLPLPPLPTKSNSLQTNV